MPTGGEAERTLHMRNLHIISQGDGQTHSVSNMSSADASVKFHQGHKALNVPKRAASQLLLAEGHDDDERLDTASSVSSNVQGLQDRLSMNCQQARLKNRQPIVVSLCLPLCVPFRQESMLASAAVCCKQASLKTHRHPSKPTSVRSHCSHSDRSSLTKGWLWSMLGAASKLAPLERLPRPLNFLSFSTIALASHAMRPPN